MKSTGRPPGPVAAWTGLLLGLALLVAPGVNGTEYQWSAEV